MGGLLVLALVPAVFSRLFALGPLDADAVRVLTGAALAVGLLTTLPVLLGSRRAAALALGLMLPLGLELGARAWVTGTWTDERLGELERMRRILAGEAVEYLTHPFLQYVGNPRFDANLSPDQDREVARPYNRFGFPDQDFQYARAPRSLRIACLGGSTTAGAYPGQLEAWLQARVPDGWTVEVYNFGMGGWTSAHSLTNYILNVVDFQPDYVVFHHAHNDFIDDLSARPDQLATLRGDYAHLSGRFAGATSALATGAGTLEARLSPSLLYRLARHQVVMPDQMHGAPPAGLPLAGGGATVEMVEAGPWPYRRNVQSLLAVAATHHQRVVLLTQPHRVGGGPMGSQARDRFIQRCNQALSELAAAHAGEVLLVDLVAALPAAPEVRFEDNIHLDFAGEQWKAAQVGAAILADWRPALEAPAPEAPAPEAPAPAPTTVAP